MHSQFKKTLSKIIRDSDLYRERLTERDLVRDFPADENFIKALHCMQAYLYARNSSYAIPVVRVMNNAHFVLNYMMNLDCTERMEYDFIVYRNSGKDKQLAAITTITLIAMLEYTDTARARTCYSVMTEDRSEEFYEGLSLYKQWLEKPTEHFSEEDFHIDLMDEIIALRAKNEQLKYENNQLQIEIKTMEKKKSATHYTEVHFHAPVGQYIDYIENQTVSFDKDMKMQIGQVGNSQEAQPYTPSAKSYCEYICREKLAEQNIYTVDEFEQMFSNATKGTAPELAAFLKRYKSQGLLDFKKHTKKQVFDTLRKHFSEMREYEYPNFAASF